LIKRTHALILNRLLNLSLRQQLSVIFVIMIVVPMSFMYFITSHWYKPFLLKVVFERNLAAAEHITEKLDRLIDDKIKILNLFSIPAEITSMDRDEQTPILEFMVNQYPELQFATVGDLTGKQIARSDGKPLDPAADFTEHEFYRQVLATGTCTISNMLIAKTSGKPVIVLAAPIKDSQGVVIGVLMIGLDPEFLNRYLQEMKLQNMCYYYVVNQAGEILLHTNGAFVDSSDVTKNLAPVKASLSGTAGIIEYEYNNQKKLAGYSYLPFARWGVIVQQPLDEAMADIIMANTAGMIAIICSCILALLLGLTLANTMSKPLARLSEATKRLAQGDLSIQLKATSQGEIGQLITTFNNMASQLLIRDAAIRESEQQYRTLVNNVSIGIYRRSINPDEPLLQANPALANILGYESVEELLTIPAYELYFKHYFQNHPEKPISRLNNIINNNEIPMQKKDGTPIVCSMIDIASNDMQDNIMWFDGVITDITERKLSEVALRKSHEELEARVAERTNELVQLNQKLAQLSISDGLTGISNRRYFDDILELEWQRSARSQLPLALIMLDIDYFKLYNDSYGHLAGDECLKQVANVLKTTIKRAYDLAARYGGEEFTIILPDTDINGAFTVAEKIRKNIEKLAINHEPSLISCVVTVSLGVVAMIPDISYKPESLIAAADKALYQAKQTGRNKTIIADSPS